MDTEPLVHEKLVTAIEHYEMPESAAELLNSDPSPLVLCGITSAGKDSLAREISSRGPYELVISHTTRAPRENHGVMEAEGVDYFFVDEDKMLDLVSKHEFIETKLVHNRDAYGTSQSEVQRILGKDKTPILVIDVQGVEEILSHTSGLRPVFILPPSFDVWLNWLERSPISEEKLQERFRSAIKEIGIAIENPAFQLMINTKDNLVETAEYIIRGHIGRDHEALDAAGRLLHQITNHIKGTS